MSLLNPPPLREDPVVRSTYNVTLPTFTKIRDLLLDDVCGKIGAYPRAISSVASPQMGAFLIFRGSRFTYLPFVNESHDVLRLPDDVTERGVSFTMCLGTIGKSWQGAWVDACREGPSHVQETAVRMSGILHAQAYAMAAYVRETILKTLRKLVAEAPVPKDAGVELFADNVVEQSFLPVKEELRRERPVFVLEDFLRLTKGPVTP